MTKEQEELIKKANSLIGEYGWYIHIIKDMNKNIVEYHTHGLLMTAGHIDLQIIPVPNLTTDTAYTIIDTVAYNILNGEKFTNDSEFTITGDDTIYKMKMVLENEFNRPLLRIIIPDKNGLYPWDNYVEKFYKFQFKDNDVRVNNYMVYGFYK